MGLKDNKAPRAFNMPSRPQSAMPGCVATALAGLVLLAATLGLLAACLWLAKAIVGMVA